MPADEQLWCFLKKTSRLTTWCTSSTNRNKISIQQHSADQIILRKHIEHHVGFQKRCHNPGALKSWWYVWHRMLILLINTVIYCLQSRFCSGRRWELFISLLVGIRGSSWVPLCVVRWPVRVSVSFPDKQGSTRAPWNGGADLWQSNLLSLQHCWS